MNNRNILSLQLGEIAGWKNEEPSCAAHERFDKIKAFIKPINRKMKIKMRYKIQGLLALLKLRIKIKSYVRVRGSLTELNKVF